MQTFVTLLNVLRYPVAVGVLIGLAGVATMGAEGEFLHVLWLIGSGIVINGAALFALIWLWRRMRARKTPEKDAQ